MIKETDKRLITSFKMERGISVMADSIFALYFIHFEHPLQYLPDSKQPHDLFIHKIRHYYILIEYK